MPDPVLETPITHLVLVSVTSLAAAILAALTGIVAHQREDSRVLLLSLAFFTLSGFFLIHGLLPPAKMPPPGTRGEGWTTLVAMAGGATFLALSSLRLSDRTRRSLLDFRGWAYGLLATSMLVAMVIAIGSPANASAYGQPATGVRWGLSLLSLALLAIAALRYIHDFSLANLRIQAFVISGIFFLVTAQIGLQVSQVWRLSWWISHGLGLVGFATILLGIIIELGQGATLAESIQALCIGSTVEKLERGYTEAILALIDAAEARDAYTQGHSRRVAQMATLIGAALLLPPESLRSLHQAGLLHDVGKIGVPDATLRKPGPLTDKEMAVIKAYPVRSEEMVQAIPSLRATLPGIRTHQERWDGSGYPTGLRGEEIPLLGRIIAVADVYDAMTSPRAARPAHGVDAALTELRGGSGVRYDPQVIEAFFRAEAWTRGPERGPA